MVSIKEEEDDNNNQQQPQQQEKLQMESESSPLHLPPKRQQHHHQQEKPHMELVPSRPPPPLHLRSHLPPKPVEGKPQMESHSQYSPLQSHLPPKPMESHSQSSSLQSYLPPKPQMESHSQSSSLQSYLPQKPQMESHSQSSPLQPHLPPKVFPQRQQHHQEENPQMESQSSHLRSHLPSKPITQIEPPPHHENLSQIIANDRRIHGFSPLHSPSQDDNKKSIQAQQPTLESINPLSPVIVVNRSIREELAVVSKMDRGVKDFPNTGGVGGGGKRSVVNDGGDRRSKMVSSISRKERREAMVDRAALGFRVCAAVFCLISFSVMAADKTQGWAGDSFDRHKEYRYCLSVGVIGFVYAGFQAFDLAYYLIATRHVIQSYLRCYFDFSMDQILTYLLVSASSAAASRVDDWQSNWGKDEFTVMASASVGMSFLAFIAFAFSSLISGYNLCNQ